MRPEKQYFVEQTGSHLDRSDFCVLTDYSRITVAETEDLRSRLAPHGAEFHVIKNRILRVAAEQRKIEGLDDILGGQLAIVSGGDAIADVIKVLEKFFDEKDKVEIKGGVLSKKAINADQVKELKSLPSRDQMRAQLLSILNTPGTQLVRLLNTPAQQMVTVLGGVPRGLLNVLAQRAAQSE